jgi:hypothetical protein
VKLRDQPPLHLTYCLNVHPGEQWPDNLASIRNHTLAIRNRLAPGKPFGLGMRLAHQAASDLQDQANLTEFREFMTREGLYAFTINGFPYGAFHGQAVKTAVYHPDWSTCERLDYTLTLSGILAQLLPEGTDGSISTLPLGYRGVSTVDSSSGSSHADDRLAASVTNLAECTIGLHSLHNKTGKLIHLGLEPEPDCLLETTDDMIRFFEGPLLGKAIPHLVSRIACTRQEAESILRRHIGICFDTCHLAIQFENLADSLARLTDRGIRISKVQLSSALEVAPTAAARQRLIEFVDPVYLHQVKEANSSGQHSSRLTAFPDLPVSLATPLSKTAESELWRIHFHLPLYFEGDGILHSTAKAMDKRFWELLATAQVAHLEIETYTFHVLPPALQAGGIESSIAKEYEWVLQRCPTGGK